MTENTDWLRPHFDRMTAEWWETTKLAHRLYSELVTLTYQDISQALDDLLGARPEVLIEKLDLEYRTYSRAVFEQAILDDTTNRSMAWKELYDCDDYAWQFKGRMRWFYNVSAVGFVVDRSSLHAYNVVIFGDKTAALFEPQEDRFVAVDDSIALTAGISLQPGSSGRYSLTKGMVII